MTVTPTTCGPGSVVYAVGDDTAGGTARTLRAGQSMVHEVLDAKRATLWTQATSAPVAASSTVLTMGTTAPTADPWNLAAVEVTATQMPPVTNTAVATYLYDPYGQPLDPATGNPLTSAAPDTSTGSYDDGWLGTKQRGYEHAATIATIEMGARQYTP